MGLRLHTFTLSLVGLTVGFTGMGLGAYLASVDNGWTSSLLYSVVGLVGAPLAALSWTSRRSLRCQVFAGVAVLLGLLGSLALMLEITHELSEIAQAWSEVPLALSLWILVWLAWEAGALARLIWFQPPRTRGRLSSRRGDAGR